MCNLVRAKGVEKKIKQGGKIKQLYIYCQFSDLIETCGKSDV